MPTRLTASSQRPDSQLLGGGVGASQEPAPLNTTMAPRAMGRNLYTILLTRIRSPGSRVFSIDPEGMENTCTTNALSRIVSASAATTITARSRQKDRFRFLAFGFLASSGF